MIDRRALLTLAAAAATLATPAAAEETAPGRIETLPRFPAAPRIRIWLPPGYDASGGGYNSLYMLDGQYAFASDSAGTNFAADTRVARLIADRSIAPTLIVAIDNLEDDRFLQYMPQSIYDRSDAPVRAIIDREVRRVGKTRLVSGEFIGFLDTQLKPFVDSHYRTSADRLNTAIFGASMAGVMSGAILVEAQRSFGRGACMSPNWAIYDERMIDFPQLPPLWARYFAQLGAPAGRRLWLDHGTRMMDAGMAPHQTAIADSLTASGWQRGCNLQTRVYQAGHAFAETAAQMDEVLAWLLA